MSRDITIKPVLPSISVVPQPSLTFTIRLVSRNFSRHSARRYRLQIVILNYTFKLDLKLLTDLTNVSVANPRYRILLFDQFLYDTLPSLRLLSVKTTCHQNKTIVSSKLRWRKHHSFCLSINACSQPLCIYSWYLRLLFTDFYRYSGPTVKCPFQRLSREVLPGTYAYHWLVCLTNARERD